MTISQQEIMISDYRCFFCFTRAFEKLLEKENLSGDAKSSFTREMAGLYQNAGENYSAPEFSKDLHNILKNYTQNADPYKGAKKEGNDQALNLYPDLKKQIQLSPDAFDTALRLSIAGNIMDFAANGTFDLHSTIKKVLNSDFSINYSEQLRSAVAKATTVLYLGDNAGEIVFDKLFIETINHPNLIYVVRGDPVINDATLEDAEYTGINKVVRVISNGYDAPSTIVNKSSAEFQNYFKISDLIISKGQGNLEGLLALNDKRIFFLLMVKCNVVAELLGVLKDSFVVFNASLATSEISLL